MWVNSHSQKQLEPLKNQPISENAVLHLHQLVCQDLQEQLNPVGQYRNNEKWQKTIVGDTAHGGAYRPPKCLDDIQYLMLAWCEWLNSNHLMNTPAIIRACLAHYYFELIHPFFDGNGRTGRLIEMLILEQAGYRFVSSAIWRYYQKNIDEYFILFNHCRKLGEKKQPFCNHDFVDFMLKGMFVTVNELHDQTNNLLSILLFQSRLNIGKANHEINDRQFSLVYAMMSLDKLSSKDLLRLPIIKTIYHNKTERTFYRDVKKLIELGYLVEIDNVLLLNF